MAIRWAVANGNWSNTATWNGGTLPTSADDVFANNFTVTIDQDITAITLRNTSNASPAITAGGIFQTTGNSGTRIITLTDATCGFRSSGFTATTSVLVISSTSGATVTINSSFNNPGVSQCIFWNGNCVLNISGSSTGTYGNLIISNSNANGATLNVVGNFSGNIFGGAGSFVLGSSGLTCNFTGNISGGGGWCISSGSNTINITGNLTGSTDAAVSASSGSTITITGNLTAGAASALNGGSNTISLTVNGNITSSSTANGVINTQASSTISVTGNLTNTSNNMAVYSPKLRISPTTQQTWTFQTGSGNRQLSTSNVFSGYPSVSDVRSGVVYASGSLTGTCNVPAAASVAFGVPVDNTTGTSIITRAQLISDVGAIVAAYTV